MKKELTEIVFILDRSGSMEGLEKDTIGGYNSFMEKQKQTEGEALVSTVLFDHEIQVIHDRLPLEKIEQLTPEQYFPRGSTALLDAIGGALHHIGNIHKYAREEDVPEKTIVVITTDGMENSSRRYSYAKVKKMIERQTEKFGWEFLFLGANIDVIEEAGKLGIQANRAVKYECDDIGTQINFDTIAETVSEFRCCSVINDNWKGKIEKYRRKRGI